MADGSWIDDFGEVLKFDQMTFEIVDGRWIKDQRVW
jgi:hypothetical protein